MNVFELLARLTQMLADNEIDGSEEVVLSTKITNLKDMSVEVSATTLKRVERCVQGIHEIHLEA